MAFANEPYDETVHDLGQWEHLGLLAAEMPEQPPQDPVFHL